MELTMPGMRAIEAAIHAGDAIVATVHHAVEAMAPAWPGATGTGHSSTTEACRC